MNDDLPTPEEILEELADRAVSQIDRLATVSFDSAWKEMTRYHRFLLHANASRTDAGSPFSYAEVAGYSWTAPHQVWTRVYDRLFKRAIERLPDDDRFLRVMAYAPRRLLSGPDDPELPPAVVASILDLGSMLIHRLETWVTKRSSDGAVLSGGDRHALGGSDARAYKAVLPEPVGAWEGTLVHLTPSGQRLPSRSVPEEMRWEALAAAWPAVWRHLINTANRLAAAAWNDDQAGTDLFREAFVRWSSEVDRGREASLDIRRPHLLLPDLMRMGWPEARQRVAALSYDRAPAANPERVFSLVAAAVHRDVLYVTAALLSLWTTERKQASTIGASTARSLLLMEGGEHEAYGHVDVDRSFTSRLLSHLRLHLAGERLSDASYPGDLDALVQRLDGMTERDIVPGRVFTPSTSHGRDDLLPASIAILAAAAPGADAAEVERMVADLASRVDLLPDVDQTLRSILHELRAIQNACGHATVRTHEVIRIIEPDVDAADALSKLEALAGAAIVTIEAERSRRLRALPLDAGKLERLRASLQAALLDGAEHVPFFSDVQVRGAAEGEAAEPHTITLTNIAKASFVEPPMQPRSSNFDEVVASSVQDHAGWQVWHAFVARSHVKMDVVATVETADFWNAIAGLIGILGSDPILVVSRQAEARTLRRMMRLQGGEDPALRIENLGKAGTYVVTVNGVDVHAAQFPVGVAWLFSGRALGGVRYATIDASADLLSLRYEAVDDETGKLLVKFAQHFEWADAVAYELHVIDPEEED
ncbi:hypothetical protein P7D22_09140 [Lichenihabitans sp. Uapishka_5]|uniref:hypothetical protein n=1 Tax=Lichenihabitans sp. Uapishka_5 TaxID=3037302 RepID=UPI0029E7E848|nr:hypothetical protein [Lichenihabitans sp. Uapishka_5]MDX7951338.1 hypothetical protein [Lichenihabitans sp. Uapishka_5]